MGGQIRVRVRLDQPQQPDAASPQSSCAVETCAAIEAGVNCLLSNPLADLGGGKLRLLWLPLAVFLPILSGSESESFPAC